LAAKAPNAAWSRGCWNRPNLDAAIRAETFRQELFHRLNVVPIAVPALEERREDIPVLAEHFIAEFNTSQGLPQRTLSEEAVALMQTMVWPGNVRQLKNLVERVLILGDGTGPIEARELPGEDLAHRKLCRHGTQRPAPQTQVSRRGHLGQIRRPRRPCG